MNLPDTFAGVTIAEVRREIFSTAVALFVMAGLVSLLGFREGVLVALVLLWASHLRTMGADP